MAVNVEGVRTLQRELGVPPGADPALDAALRALERADAAGLPTALAAYLDALRSHLGLSEPQWRERLEQLAAESVSFLSPVAVAVSSGAARFRALQKDLDLGVSLGPAEVSVSGPLVAVRADEMPLSLRLPVAHLPVNGLAAALKLGPLDVSGTGFLESQPRPRAGAALTADLGPAKATLLLLIATEGSALALLGTFRADFRPNGIQLGLGFSLDAVGGIVGINHKLEPERLRARLADGSAMDALFGASPTTASDLRRALQTLGDVFPPAPGWHVAGPMLRLGWLNVAGWSLARADVGVVVELPSARVYVPGRVMVEVPGPSVPLVQLRLDVLGEVDVPGQRLALDAALVDSRVLAVLKVSGTAAVRLAWGAEPVVLATVGGFYPGFDTRPAVVPPQNRVRIDLGGPIPAGLSLRLEGYAATAAGTLQAGAAATLAFEVAGTGISGGASFDAIVQMSPLWFQAQVAGSVSLRALGRRLLSVGLRGTLTGPGPLVLRGEAYGEIFGVEVGGSRSFVLDAGGGADRTPADAIREAVARQLREPRNLVPVGAGPSDVALAVRAADQDRSLLAPGQVVVWDQQSFPIGDPVTKADGRILVAPVVVSAVTAAGAATPGEVRRTLPTALFTDLTAADQLNVRPFDRRRTGIQVVPVTTEAPTQRGVSTDYRTVDLPVTDAPAWFLTKPVALSHAVGTALLALDRAPALSAGVTAEMKVAEEEWAVLSSEVSGPAVSGGYTSSASAHAHASASDAGRAVPAAATAEVSW